MSTSTIMVQMADTRWTWAAMYEACAQARKLGAEVALVKLLPLEFLAWMGGEDGTYTFTDSESEDIRNYEAIAQENGVETSVHVFPYTRFDQGVVDAADKLNADTVFVELHDAPFKFLHTRHIHKLEHDLAAHRHHLRAYDVPATVNPH